MYTYVLLFNHNVTHRAYANLFKRPRHVSVYVFFFFFYTTIFENDGNSRSVIFSPQYEFDFVFFPFIFILFIIQLSSLFNKYVFALRTQRFKKENKNRPYFVALTARMVLTATDIIVKLCIYYVVVIARKSIL